MESRIGEGESEIEIGPLTTTGQLQRCEELQKEIWGIPDIAVVPAHMLVAGRMSGGSVLGAFEPGGQLIGFAFSTPGVIEGQVILYSHMAGVLDQWRDKGVGFNLKLAQRESALSQGIDTIVWTFDPLEPRNARLNFGKLGVICDRYEVNVYGEMETGRYRDIETDRFLVKWYVKSERVRERLEARAHAVLSTPPPSRAIVVSAIGPELIRPDNVELGLEEREICFQIPMNFQNLKAADLGLARSWREVVRSVCLHYLTRGYVVEEFISRRGEPDEGNFYLLRQRETGDLEGR